VNVAAPVLIIKISVPGKAEEAHKFTEVLAPVHTNVYLPATTDDDDTTVPVPNTKQAAVNPN